MPSKKVTSLCCLMYSHSPVDQSASTSSNWFHISPLGLVLFYFFLIKQVLFKYSESIKMLNPHINEHSLYSEAVPLHEPADFCNVVMSQLYSHYPKPRPQHSCGCKNSSKANAQTGFGGACSDRQELTNRSSLHRGLKRQYTTAERSDRERREVLQQWTVTE